MKNYAINKWDKMSFILGYDIIELDGGSVIEVHYGGGNIYLPYSKEIEEDLINKMEIQIENAFLQIERYNPKAYDIMISIYNLMFFELTTVRATQLQGTTSGKVQLGCAIAFLILTLLKEGDLIRRNSIIKDIKKNKLYLDNKEIFDELFITINDVDKMSYSKVKRIVKKKNGNK